MLVRGGEPSCRAGIARLVRDIAEELATIRLDRPGSALPGILPAARRAIECESLLVLSPLERITGWDIERFDHDNFPDGPRVPRSILAVLRDRAASLRLVRREPARARATQSLDRRARDDPAGGVRGLADLSRGDRAHRTASPSPAARARVRRPVAARLVRRVPSCAVRRASEPAARGARARGPSPAADRAPARSHLARPRRARSRARTDRSAGIRRSVRPDSPRGLDLGARAVRDPARRGDRGDPRRRRRSAADVWWSAARAHPDRGARHAGVLPRGGARRLCGCADRERGARGERAVVADPTPARRARARRPRHRDADDRGAAQGQRARDRAPPHGTLRSRQRRQSLGADPQRCSRQTDILGSREGVVVLCLAGCATLGASPAHRAPAQHSPRARSRRVRPHERPAGRARPRSDRARGRCDDALCRRRDRRAGTGRRALRISSST